MSISVSGLGSGLNYESWIEQLVALKQEKIDAVSAKATAVNSQESALTSLQTKYKNLQEAIKAFTSALSTEDVFNQKTASSSSEAVSASVNSTTLAQDIKVEVSRLATATTATSGTVASYADENTSLKALSITGDAEGGKFFSLYVDGVKHKITIGENATMKDVMDQINGDGGSNPGIDGVTASISNGLLTIEADSTKTVTLGATSDTSNFLKAMSMAKDASNPLGSYSSSRAIFDTNTSSYLVNSADPSQATEIAGGVAITESEFRIGETTFYVKDGETTIDNLISQINKSDCGATASWDVVTGKMKLTATDEGALSLNIEQVSGNFTDIMGFTKNVDGTSVLNLDNQKLGQNALLSINGTEIISASNTVTSDISGIKGLTLTLNSETTTEATVSVTQDTSKVVDALTEVVSAYNMAITSTDTATGKNGVLHGESILSSLRNNIRKLVTSSTEDAGIFKTLASIGISTGAFSTDTSADTNSLKIDTEKLTEALKNNSDSVKDLLLGAGTSDGIFDKMSTVLDKSLDVTKGYFTTREKSLEKQASRYTEKVSDMTEDLERYKEKLETKFAAMDELISSLQNSASVFDSYFNKKSEDD